MLSWWRRRRKRRRLSPVVVELPRMLAHRYGGKDWYEPKQVERALEELRRSSLAPFAYAIACDTDGFRQAFPGEAVDRRRHLRQEIAGLFALDESDLALKKLRRTRIRSAFQTADGESWDQLGGHGGRQSADGTPD